MAFNMDPFLFKNSDGVISLIQNPVTGSLSRTLSIIAHFGNTGTNPGSHIEPINGPNGDTLSEQDLSNAIKQVREAKTTGYMDYEIYIISVTGQLALWANADTPYVNGVPMNVTQYMGQYPRPPFMRIIKYGLKGKRYGAILDV